MNTPQPQSANGQPNKWLAAILGFFFPTISQLYVAQPTWALVYFVGAWTASVGIASAHGAALAGDMLMLAVGAVCAVQAYRFAARYPADRPRPRYSRWAGGLGIFLLAAAATLLLIRAFVLEPFRMPSAGMLPTLVPGTYIGVQKWGYGRYNLLRDADGAGVMASALHRGDIVVFDAPGKPRLRFTQRVIGLPGDKLVYRDDKTLAINGKAVPQQPLGDYAVPSPASPGMRKAQDTHFSRLAETLDGAAFSVLVRQDLPWVYREYAYPFRDGCRYDDHALRCTVPRGRYFLMGDNRDSSRDSRYFGFVPAADIVGKVVYIW